MKNKKLVLLLLLVLLIVTIVFLVIRVRNNNSNEVVEKTLLEIIKEDAGQMVETSDDKKVDYNQLMIDSNAFKYLIDIGKVATTCIDGNEYTDSQKLAFASCYALEEDYDNLVENSKEIVPEQATYVKFEYLNEIAKRFFGKDIVKENLENTIDGEYIEVSLPTSEPENLYKFKEIKYNAESDVYSIYFDEINPELENYAEVSNTEKLEYNSDAVLKTYRILYKKVDGKEVVLGIHQII